MKRKIFDAGISGKKQDKYSSSTPYKRTVAFLPFRMEIGSYMFSLSFLCFWIYAQWGDEYKELKDGTEKE